MTGIDKNNQSIEPRKFTEDVRNRYLDLLKLGYGRLVAADTVGVSSRTVRRFYHGHPEFLEEMGEAEGRVVDRAQRVLIELMDDGDFQAAKLILERLDRQKWGDKNHTVKVEVEGAITHEMIEGKSVSAALDAIDKEIEARREALTYDAIEVEEL
jgi:hypothetical protein